MALMPTERMGPPPGASPPMRMTASWSGSKRTYRIQVRDVKMRRNGGIVANREALGAFITEGNQLLAQAANQNSTLPDPAANEWASRVESFLTDNIGDS